MYGGYDPVDVANYQARDEACCEFEDGNAPFMAMLQDALLLLGLLLSLLGDLGSIIIMNEVNACLGQPHSGESTGDAYGLDENVVA